MLQLPLLLLAQASPTFRSEVAVVHVDIEVREDGHPISGLERESFRVTDEGKPQNILYFGREEEPLDVVLLFDARRELRSDLKRIAEAAHTAMSDLRPGDQIAAMAFGVTAGNCKTNLFLDFTSDFGMAERTLADQTPQPELAPQGSGFCSIQKGLASAARLLQGQPDANRRRAIIVITDDKGVPAKPAVVRNTLHDLWRADAVVLGVFVHSGEVVVSIGPPYRGARYAAGRTGSDILKTEDAAEGLREMMRRLRSRYGLYYALPPGRPGEERKVQVRLASGVAKQHSRAVIRARTGYVYPSSN